MDEKNRALLKIKDGEISVGFDGGLPWGIFEIHVMKKESFFSKKKNIWLGVSVRDLANMHLALGKYLEEIEKTNAEIRGEK